MFESTNMRIQQNMNAELIVDTKGIGAAVADKNARKAMRAAEIAYQKELGIYKPTLGERVRALFAKR